MTNLYQQLPLYWRGRYTCAMDDDIDEDHDTVTVFVRCCYCEGFEAAGYECDTCGHEVVTKPHQLPGHGPGKCVDNP